MKTAAQDAEPGCGEGRWGGVPWPLVSVGFKQLSGCFGAILFLGLFVNCLGWGPACLPGMLRWCLRFAVEMTGEESCQITPPDDKGHFSASAAVTKGKAWSLQLSQQICTLLPSAMCFLSVWSLQGEASVRVKEFNWQSCSFPQKLFFP